MTHHCHDPHDLVEAAHDALEPLDWPERRTLLARMTYGADPQWVDAAHHLLDSYRAFANEFGWEPASTDHGHPVASVEDGHHHPEHHHPNHHDGEDVDHAPRPH